MNLVPSTSKVLKRFSFLLGSISVVFLITGTFADRKACAIGLVAAAILRILSKVVDCYAVQIIIGNLIWFVLGMAACICDFPAIAAKLKWWAWIATGVFLLLSLTRWSDISFLMGMLACGTVMIMSVRMDGKPSALAEYTMPVFLMHTIFAAGIRTVLLKLGITAPAVHVILGMVASIGGPIVAAEAMKKLKLDILYQPGKYIKLKK